MTLCTSPCHATDLTGTEVTSTKTQLYAFALNQQRGIRVQGHVSVCLRARADLGKQSNF
jgi:hypothetical protein